MHALHYNIQYKGIHLEKWETILAKPFFQKKKKESKPFLYVLRISDLLVTARTCFGHLTYSRLMRDLEVLL